MRIIFERDRHWTCVVLLVAGLLAALAGGCGDKKLKYPTCGKDKDCREGEHCVNKRCQQCGQDDHCASGQVCKLGACVADPDAVSEVDPRSQPGYCDRNEDCEDDEDCVENKCQRPWMNETDPNLDCALTTVYFDFDDASVRPEARETLSGTAQCIQKAPPARGVFIEGHTDASGTEEYNIALSERRAQTVADYLARLGVDPARFHVVPKGETVPAGAGEDRDRRVEFKWK